MYKGFELGSPSSVLEVLLKGGEDLNTHGKMAIVSTQE